MGIVYLKGQGGSKKLPLTETTEYELLADIEVTQATTNVYINGLSIGKGDEVVLVSDVVNASASGNDFYLFANNNIVNTNYYMQRIYADSTSVVGARINEARYCEAEGSTKTESIANIKLTNNGYYVVQSNFLRNYGGSGVDLFSNYLTSTFTISSLTSLTIGSFASSGIGIGSRFQLYRATGEVTQTWVTT